MSGVFLTLLNMSITASWLILAVIVIRLLLKKAPKWISCALWALVAIRLICPFSFESKLSLIPASQTIPQNIAMQAKPQIDSGIAIVNDVINPVIARQFKPDPLTSANPLQIVLPVLSIVWIIGMVALLGYAMFSYIRLKRSVGASIAVKDNIMACDEVHSPFILGILCPMIYVPSALKGDALDYVITHETAHLKRHDHWLKPLGYLLLTVYWFNPLCWLAYVLLCRDIELACDEKVIRNLDNGSKAAYSQALLDCSYSRKWITACPLAFGEVGVKERVKSILNYKKPAFWIIVVGILACIVAAVCLLTNPIKKQDTITYIHRSTSIGNRADFNISFGQKARSAMLVAELWQHGERTAESTMVVPADTQNITILFSDRQENMYLTGETVQIDTDQVAGSLVTLFPVPEGVRGWSFSSWSNGQTVDIEAGKEIILAAMNFDTGKGTRSVFDLLDNNNQQIPADIDCVLMVRAIFYAEELPRTMETAAQLLVSGAAETEPEEAVDWAESEMPSPVGIYKYEEAGFGGDFVLTLNLDRTFSYTEGPYSSYLGSGTWTAVDDTTIRLIDPNREGNWKAYFTFAGNTLCYDKRQSAPFTYVDLPDNAVFTRTAKETLSDEENVCVGLITDIHNGIIRLQDLTGAVPGTITQILYVPIAKMPSSPEPRIGDRLEVRYHDFETEAELANPMEIMEVSADAIISLRVIREDSSRTIRDVAFCIDGVTYYGTGRVVSVEPDENLIEYAEIPVGGANAAQISAYAILQKNHLALAFYDGKWYEFVPADEALYLSYSLRNNEMLFFLWPYEEKASYSAHYAELTGLDEAASYEVNMSTIFTYGIPNENEVQYEQALKIAMEHCQKCFPTYTKQNTQVGASYDITDPEQPLWSIVIVNGEDWFAPRYLVVINGISGQVVHEQELEWAELRQDFDYDLLYYSGRRINNPITVTSPEEHILSESPLTQLLVHPMPGTIDHVENDPTQSYYTVFLTGIDQENAEAYIGQLMDAGYSQVTAAKEAGIMTWLLTKPDAALSIAYDGNGEGMTVMVRPTQRK